MKVITLVHFGRAIMRNEKVHPRLESKTEALTSNFDFPHLVKFLFYLTTLQILEDINHETLNVLASIQPSFRALMFLKGMCFGANHPS